MTIEILPARLANQIAAGEVVERPASVVKELVENSLDAGATSIKIDIEKGGAKRIRISDNGMGIVKDELTLALSRHATSKIKSLTDLEGICSLGFRGEALASISSVARLTLTSKPESQETAWQACAQGRDMEVTIQPAAHPQGTTIDVVDLFFNTPARRKFLRTEKTEFSHIEEVIKRIALARFDVAFTLTHNERVIRQYRVATNDNQKSKRVAQICGQTFINNALKVDCQHDGLTLTGWIASPSFYRNQNDICYSYVNGRMMRDKLINHAIRQSYQEMLPTDTYPAFVLFLELDVRDVDVNVHPAKHEVRFHQGRYIHDFIYSVCHRALLECNDNLALNDDSTPSIVDYQEQVNQTVTNNAYHQVNEYVTPLKVAEAEAPQGSYSTQPASYSTGYLDRTPKVNMQHASEAYQSLMTPHQTIAPNGIESQLLPTLNFVAPEHAIYFDEQRARLVSLVKLERRIQEQIVVQQWQHGFTSQPLLLPIKIQVSAENVALIEHYKEYFDKLGISIQLISKTSIQIRQYPALLRQKDVNQSFTQLLLALTKLNKENDSLSEQDWQQCLSLVLAHSDERINEEGESRLKVITQQLIQYFPKTIIQELTLNSTVIDLKSSIEALT